MSVCVSACLSVCLHVCQVSFFSANSFPIPTLPATIAALLKVEWDEIVRWKCQEALHDLTCEIMFAPHSPCIIRASRAWCLKWQVDVWRAVTVIPRTLYIPRWKAWADSLIDLGAQIQHNKQYRKYQILIPRNFIRKRNEGSQTEILGERDTTCEFTRKNFVFVCHFRVTYCPRDPRHRCQRHFLLLSSVLVRLKM